METMRLLNLTKLVVLSTALSDTCLLATQNWHIEVGFKNVSREDIANGKKIVTLYIHFVCRDSENWRRPCSGQGCYVNPIDRSGEVVDWTVFSEEEFAKHSKDSAKTGSPVCHYEAWHAPT